MRVEVTCEEETVTSILEYNEGETSYTVTVEKRMDRIRITNGPNEDPLELSEVKVFGG